MRAPLLLAAVALAACSAEGDRTGLVVTPGMAYSIPFDPYDPNPVTPNGLTLQLPPEGAVPINGARFPYGAGPEEVARAGRELVNPTSPTAAQLARGQHVFDIFCLVCHGKDGAGEGPIIGRFPHPPSLLAERPRSLPDGSLFHIITRGGKLMPSYALQMAPADRWAAVLHVRALQGAKK